MKPAPFDYRRPGNVEQALDMLTESRDRAVKVLAGGQSLIPLMNFRLATPDVIIDVNRLDELAHIHRGADGLHIGALVRHDQLVVSAIVQERWPLLSAAAGLIGHMQIRTMGTIGGSVAHADPSAELPVALTALGATILARSRRGSRQVAAQDFFVGHLQTVLDDDELITEVIVPDPGARSGWSFQEHVRRHGDFALGGCAVQLGVDRAGALVTASIALLGAGPTPKRAGAAETVLLRAGVGEGTALRAADAAVTGITPSGDIHGSATYRAELIRDLTALAIREAGARTREVAGLVEGVH